MPNIARQWSVAHRRSEATSSRQILTLVDAAANAIRSSLSLSSFSAARRLRFWTSSSVMIPHCTAKASSARMIVF
jgi:hypothetical protein